MFFFIILAPGDQLNTRFLCKFFFGFSPIKNCWAEVGCKLVRGLNDSRYEQFEISPETTGQDLRSVDCEQRHTDRCKENYGIDDRILS